MAKATRNDVRSNFGCGSQTPRGSGVHQKLPPGWKPARCTPLLVRSKAGQGKAKRQGALHYLYINILVRSKPGQAKAKQGKARQSKARRQGALHYLYIVRLPRPKTGAMVPGGR